MGAKRDGRRFCRGSTAIVTSFACRDFEQSMSVVGVNSLMWIKSRVLAHGD
jgi:hypothetical protein